MGILKEKLIRKLRGDVMEVTVGATGLTPSQIYNVAEAAKTLLEGAETPTPRSVSGATEVYLRKVQADFKNFSKSDAETDIKDFIREFIAVKYEGREELNAKNASVEVINSIQKADELFKVSDIVFNKISIAGYKKSEEYATINYQVSCGFDLTPENGGEKKRLETRYKIDYSLRFVQSGTETALSYVCPNCNATLGVLDVHECPYCGAKLVMDTLYSWYITSITEA